MSMEGFQSHHFTLRQLQYVLAIEQTGGFGAAARLCGVSQPSLSAQVAKLEEALGVQVFERHSRGVRVTAGGRVLLERLRGVLDGARQLTDTARSLVDPYGVVLRVGIIPTVAPYLLPSVVESLRAAERSPAVHWIEMRTSWCERALADGELDAMVIADPPAVANTSEVDLGWEPFYVIVPRDHEISGPVTLAQVADHEVLLLDDGNCLTDHTVALCLQPGARQSPYRATSMATLVQMVAAGLGISVVPGAAVPAETRRAHVRAVPLAASGVGRTLRLVWRTKSPVGALLEDLAGQLQAALLAALSDLP